MDRGVTEAREPKRALLGMLLTRVGNPLNWSPTDKCLFAALLLLPFVAWYAVVYYFALRRPEIAPYLDQAVLPFAFRLQLAFVGGWLAIIVPRGEFQIKGFHHPVKAYEVGDAWRS